MDSLDDPVFRLCPDALIVGDADGTIRWPNPAALRISGFPGTELAGKSFRDLIHPEDTAAFDQLLETVASGRAFHGCRIRAVRRSGDLMWQEWNAAPYTESGSFLAIGRDISRHIKEERERLYRQHLDEGQYRQLKDDNEELAAFNHSVSHDLKEPMRHIESIGALLAEEYGERLGADGCRLLQRMRSAVTDLSGLLQGLQTLADVAQRQVDTRWLDLTAMAGEQIAALRSAYPEHPVHVVIPQGLHVRGDQGLIRVLLKNLLQNAWKYTMERPGPRVEIGPFGEGSASGFYVRDNGVGIDPAHARDMFLPFRRFDSRQEGSGIGLATAKRIAARHGASIWAEGAPGAGTTLYVTLPTDSGTP